MPGLFFYNYQHCNHSSLLRGKTRGMCPSSCNQPKLQSTSLLRGKTSCSTLLFTDKGASIHFPLAREDILRTERRKYYDRFNPLPSCEGRHGTGGSMLAANELQSTSLLRGKTGMDKNLKDTVMLQSTSLLRGKT